MADRRPPVRAGRPAAPQRPTVRGIAPPPHLDARGVPTAPESSGPGTTFQELDDRADRTTVQPTRIITIGPPATQTARTLHTPPLPTNPYAVDNTEQTLFDHRPNFTAPDDRARQPPGSAPDRQALASTPNPGAMTRAPSGPLTRAPLAERRPGFLDPRLVLLSDPDSARSSSFRLLRDNLLAKKAPRIIAISSGAMHEGKTTCAINLALALSERPSTRVLLLEGNFFAPSLGQIFQIDAMTPPTSHMNLPWLSPYRVVDVLRGFHVAALVHQNGEPPLTFNSRWFDMAIGHLLGSNYDHLIIDAAALDGSPAVAQVVAVADGTILTVRSGGTTAQILRRAADQIPQGRALGVTLMDG